MVVLKRTGTDDLPAAADDGATGISMTARTPASRSASSAQTSVAPAAGSTPAGASAGQRQASAGGRPARPAGPTAPPPVDGADRLIDPARRALQRWARSQPGRIPRHPDYANPNAPMADRLNFIANTHVALVQRDRSNPNLLTTIQQRRLLKWRNGLASGTISEDQILKTRGGPTINSLEKRIDAALKEEFRHNLARATGMPVVKIVRSDNEGDRAADLHAQLAGQPRAYAFVTETDAHETVQFDNFDFRTRQPIENKSISELVLVQAPRAEKLREYRSLMERGAVAARDSGVGPVRWDVPPDVDLDLVDHVYRNLPSDLRAHVQIPLRPAAPIRVGP
jgi:hypothetical protein